MIAPSSLNSIREAYAGVEGQVLVDLMVRDFKGRIAVISSFGAESAILLHMVAKADPSTPVIFLDTGKQFWETLGYRSKLVDFLGLTDVRNIQPDANALAAQDPDGKLHASNPDLCCHIRKTIPLQKALEGFDVIISGRKRYHGADRRNLNVLSLENERLKAEPLAGFSALDIELYRSAHALPVHPLTEMGYFSIGCEPCTVPGGSADDPRAGRWAGTAKTECGIHWTHNGKPMQVTTLLQ